MEIFSWCILHIIILSDNNCGQLCIDTETSGDDTLALFLHQHQWTTICCVLSSADWVETVLTMCLDLVMGCCLNEIIQMIIIVLCGGINIIYYLATVRHKEPFTVINTKHSLKNLKKLILSYDVIKFIESVLVFLL